MAQVQIIYWHDIPAQITIKKSRREQIKHLLSDRFEKAIDMAAMRAGEESEEDYLTAWIKSEPYEVEGDDLTKIAQTIATEIEAEYDQEKLKRLIKNGGHDGDKAQ